MPSTKRSPSRTSSSPSVAQVAEDLAYLPPPTVGAVRRGTPTLLVQAGKMSTPILARLGFRSVAKIDVLVDSTE